MFKYLYITACLFVLALVVTCLLPESERTWDKLGPNIVSEVWGLFGGMLLVTVALEIHNRQEMNQRSYRLIVSPALNAADEVMRYGAVFMFGFDRSKEDHEGRADNLIRAIANARDAFKYYGDQASVEDRERVRRLLDAAEVITEDPSHLSNGANLDRYLGTAREVHELMLALMKPIWLRFGYERSAKQLGIAIAKYDTWRASGDERPAPIYHWPPDW